MNEAHRRGARIRLAVAGAATIAVLGPLTWLWYDSLMPAAYSVMDMGYADHGDGSRNVAGGHDTHHASGSSGHAGHSASGRDVTSFTADPGRKADVTVTLIARKQRFQLPTGRSVDGYTLNGTSPGPVI